MLSAAPTFTQRELLASGGLLILPSDAAARQYRHAFNAEQLHGGQTVWQPAQIFSWDQWLQSLWSECILSGVDGRLVLNGAQEHQLWCEVVQNTRSEEHETLHSIDALAELASTAWRLAGAYRSTGQLRTYASTHDTRTFANWAEDFTDRCHSNTYLSRAGLEEALSDHITSHSLLVKEKPHVVGFLAMTPQQRHLLQALRDAGVPVMISQVRAEQGGTAKRAVLSAVSQEHEVRAICVWIRHFLDSEAVRNKASVRVGVVLPDLDAERPALETNLRELLAPELQLVGTETSAKPYEFAGSEPLNSHPMIAAALDLLRLAVGPVPLSTVSVLLLSPYLETDEDLDRSAQFDARNLRQSRLLRPEIDLVLLLRLAHASDDGKVPLRWIQALYSFLANSLDKQKPRTFGGWSEWVRHLTQVVGWPGKPSSTTDLETADAWEHTLDLLSTLDFAGKRLSLKEYLRVLERQAQLTPLTKNSGTAPVQILRPDDIAGMTFDLLICARATDTNLPLRESANPLIDWRLQVDLGMPGADPTQRTERTQRYIDQTLSCTSNLLYTFAATTPEGQQRLSPLIARLDWPVHDAESLLDSALQSVHVEPEVVLDSAPLPPLPTSKIHGGASVLQYQAACGFRAFAEVRLRAGELEVQEPGFDARESGELLHRVMSLFWTDTKSQLKLQRMPSVERNALLTQCIDRAFGRSVRPDDDWDKAYVALQKQRLTSLLNQWLEHELKRGPFEIVATELKQEIAVGPLDLQVRVDRIDSTDDGVFLVDYKTGYSARPQSWLGDRPDEPQLPLYALLPEEGTLAGLAFARVRAGESMGWQGYAANEGVLKERRVVRDLEALLTDWQIHLRALAEAFAAGDATVRPKDFPSTCTHCGQRLLCRLDANTLLALSEAGQTGQENASDG